MEARPPGGRHPAHLALEVELWWQTLIICSQKAVCSAAGGGMHVEGGMGSCERWAVSFWQSCGSGKMSTATAAGSEAPSNSLWCVLPTPAAAPLPLLGAAERRRLTDEALGGLPRKLLDLRSMVIVASSLTCCWLPMGTWRGLAGQACAPGHVHPTHGPDPGAQHLVSHNQLLCW